MYNLVFMKQKQLDRIIRLVKRTGDRFVILDRDTDEAMVVMNLDEYEDLLNTTTEVENLAEEEMLSRLNSDINRWQEQNEKRATLPQIQYDEPEEIDEVEEEEQENEPEFEKLPEIKDLAEVSQEIEIETSEVAPNANFAEEDLSDLPEGEEEKFYLEPIE